MSGTSTWSWDGGWDDAPVEGAIVTENRIAFDVKTEGDELYSVVITPVPTADGWWRGEWRRRSDAERGPCSAKLSKDDGIELAGFWTENGGELEWSVELTP